MSEKLSCFQLVDDDRTTVNGPLRQTVLEASGRLVEDKEVGLYCVENIASC
jgi:hypothetical protein